MMITYFKHDTRLHVLDMKEKVMTEILYQRKKLDDVINFSYKILTS